MSIHTVRPREESLPALSNGRYATEMIWELPTQLRTVEHYNLVHGADADIDPDLNSSTN
jgi:hypothetical protein